MTRLQRAARDGLRRVRPARRAVRGADRQAPAGQHRGRTSPPYRRQLRRLGLAHDPRRSVATTDVALLPLDAVDLPADLQLLVRHATPTGPGRSPSWWPSSRPGTRADAGRRAVGATSTPSSAAAVVDDHRLAYLAEAPVNWCPGLGTVLANEEVTADGRSESGNFPVFKRDAEAVDDADHRVRRPADRRPGPAGLARVDQAHAAQLDRPLGRAPRVDFPVDGHRATPHPRSSPPGRTRCSARPTWCWPPSTRWSTSIAGRAVARGPLPASWTGGRSARRARRSPPTGTRGSAPRATWSGRPRAGTRPASSPGLSRQPGQRRADPGLRRRLRADGLRHRRDHGRARPGRARLGVRRGLRPADRPRRVAADRPDFDGEAFTRRRAGDQQRLPRRAGRRRRQARRSSTGSWPTGSGESTVTYKLRDWLFCRQRYWGEPFPIVYDETGLPDRAARVDAARRAARGRRLLAPHLRPRRRRRRRPSRRWHGPTTGSTSSSTWATGPGTTAGSRTSMPQWAGSCWYELRYLDPTNENAFVDPDVERYWMGPRAAAATSAASTCTSAASSTPCCTCCTPASGTRCCSTSACLDARSRSTGCSTRATSRPTPTPTSGVVRAGRRRCEERDGGWTWHGEPVNREYGKMGK